MHPIPKHCSGFTLIYFKRVISLKLYDKPDDSEFDMVNFAFFMATFPVLPITECAVFDLFGLLECLVMPVINFNCLRLQQGYRVS